MTLEPHVMQLALRRRLRLPLPLCPNQRGPGRPRSRLPDHKSTRQAARLVRDLVGTRTPGPARC